MIVGLWFLTNLRWYWRWFRFFDLEWFLLLFLQISIILFEVHIVLRLELSHQGIFILDIFQGWNHFMELHLLVWFYRAFLKLTSHRLYQLSNFRIVLSSISQYFYEVCLCRLVCSLDFSGTFSRELLDSVSWRIWLHIYRSHREGIHRWKGSRLGIVSRWKERCFSIFWLLQVSAYLWWKRHGLLGSFCF